MVCPELQRTVTIILRISFTASIRTVSQLLGVPTQLVKVDKLTCINTNK